MNPSEKFRKFAAECRSMAKFARSRESKAAWDRLAARWVRYAEVTECHWQPDRIAKADSKPQPQLVSPRRRKGRLSQRGRTEQIASGFG